MGLTVHYEFKLDSASVEGARAKIAALRNLALKLPFAQVGELVEIQGEECRFDRENADDPHVFFKLRAGKITCLENDTFSSLDSTYLIAFDTMPGEGCESAAFGLALHAEPAAVNDWIWMSFCKTQYASNPECGGIENFLKCHLMIVRMLDEAQKLGILCEVLDEGNYWETRQIEKLVETLRKYNVLIAGIAGHLKDSQEEGSIASPIYNYPNFEYLEAEASRLS
ncbi:MAG: hypothetical protein KME26_11050 [Oscillatoria princeps RMCB-10]|jgi:hypothetical protein|nr:hypothetical protein [Oscillatoria princeps RMCB-10]